MWDSIENITLGPIPDRLFQYHVYLESSLYLKVFISTCS